MNKRWPMILSVLIGLMWVPIVSASPWMTVPYQHNTPDSRDAYDRAMNYAKQKKWTLAIEWFEKAIDRDANNRAAYSNLGVVYSEMGERKKAVAMFQKAMTVPIVIAKPKSSPIVISKKPESVTAVESKQEQSQPKSTAKSKKSSTRSVVKAKESKSLSAPKAKAQPRVQLSERVPSINPQPSESSERLVQNMKKERQSMIHSHLERTVPNYQSLYQDDPMDWQPFELTDNQDVQTIGRIVEVEDKVLELCRAEQLGFEVLCDRKWDMNLSGPSVIIKIDQDPNVFMVVERIDRPIYFLEDFTADYIRKNKIYMDDFEWQRLKLPNIDAVQVVGRAKNNPYARHQDYYFIDNGQLFGLFFVVNPGKQFAEYNTIFRYLAGSFKMI